MPDVNLPKELLRLLKPQLPQMLSTLRRFVTAESPSLDKAVADRCCGVIAEEWRKQGVRVERIRQKHRGDLLCITYAATKSRPSGQLLVLGHYDTVYSAGTLARMPFRVKGGKAYGPGTFDMKGGIVQALFALQALQMAKLPLHKRLVFLWTSDEEIGSEAGRKFFEPEARRSDAVFVLEPSFGPRGLLKTARKGVGEAELIVHGRASHAGLAPGKGINAIHELALQIARLKEWNDLPRGISINAGLIEGGTRPNVIPDRAKAILDLRALRSDDMQEIEKKLRGLRPILPGAKLEVRGGFNRAPLEHKVSAELFQRASALAKLMGFTIGEGTAGGGSDGNLTAALGIATLDGLGAIGDGAHSPGEYILARSLPQRAALLAALLLHS